MTAAQTNFDAYSRAHPLDASESLLAFPSFGSLLARIKASFGGWVQAQADTRLWEVSSADARVQAEIACAAAGA